MPEKPNLTPHPYRNDAWFMLGYLRMCIEKTGAISTSDWLEALERSKLPVVNAEEGNRAALKSDLAKARAIISKREDDDLIYGPGEEENDEDDEAFDQGK